MSRLFSLDKNELILQLLSSMIVLFIVIPAGHFLRCVIADKLGDDTPRLNGKLTLNPFAHLDLFGSICMVITGFGWGKPCPINENRFKNRKLGRILVALAAPGACIILALFFMILYKLSFRFNISLGYGGVVMALVVQLSSHLAVFYLLPIPTLNGGDILLAFLPPKYEYMVVQYQIYILIGILLLLQVGFVRNILLALSTGLIMILDKITFFI